MAPRMTRRSATAALSVAAMLGLLAAAQSPPATPGAGPTQAPAANGAPSPAWRALAPKAYARALCKAVSAESLARDHELLTTEPHVAGTGGDMRQIERIRAAFESMGLATQVQWFRCLLARPEKALLEIVDASGNPKAAGMPSGAVALPVNERNLAEDPATAHPDLAIGWNAFSGNGDVTAPVIYANYGLREDYDRLRELGVDVKGKIVLVRYGRCFRGFKARFAEERGAAGVLLYTDPADGGFTKGKVWPEGGGWANDACIQRGTLDTLPYPGDPGTPGVFSADNVPRDEPARLDLPRIPVQPIGYGAAGAILGRFQGPEAPEAWRGGLALPYRLEGGPDLRLHLVVRQQRFLGTSGNVIATVPGLAGDGEFVVVGCHHDAWGYGAADPGAGTICLLEAARCVAEGATQGIVPARRIVFAAWGAEEFGIIGSTEWCEAFEREVRGKCVAYLNLDMAAMGDNPGLAISPELDEVARQASAIVPAAGQPDESVLERLQRGAGDRPLFGPLGGGSDHVAFVCRDAVPSVAISAGGAKGTSYHSNYDTVNWYRSTVGSDYASAVMVTRLALAITAMCSQTDLPPWRLAPVARAGLRHLDAIIASTGDPSIRQRVERLRAGFVEMETRGAAIDAELDRGGPIQGVGAASVRMGLFRAVHAFLDPAGLDGRPWFQSLFAASDRNDGYAPCMLPLVAEAVQDGDADRLDAAIERTQAAQQRALNGLTVIESGLRTSEP
jgi:N-acetylated-alpha-linked acidic dipeptidase